MPVKTMARPASSAASITLWSFTEPPGWITAVAPASATTINPSGKGKKASDAADDPTVRGLSQPARRAVSWALMAAMRPSETLNEALDSLGSASREDQEDAGG